MIFGRSYNDVTALVLSTGEAMTEDAVASLHRQTVPPLDTIVVRDVVPFHKALNTGAAQVKTPFFVQVDADMILDEHCIATLRRNMRRDVGIVVGHLRDALSGQVVGVKLFRKSCFDTVSFRDSISPDTDFGNDIAEAGWKTVYVGKPKSGEPDAWPTFGEHRPDYTQAYTYAKFLLEGCRYRYRDAVSGFRWHLSRLATSPHASALIAQIGLARGIFLEPGPDLLGRPNHDEEFRSLGPFLSGTQGAARSGTIIGLRADTPPDERFRHFYRLGFTLFRANELATFRSAMSLFDESADNSRWTCKVALCKGLLAHDADDKTIAKDYAILEDFAHELPIHSAHVGNASFEAVSAYAAEIGLKSFVIDGPNAAEYQAEEAAHDPVYRKTGRAVRTALQAGRRPRITAPLRLFGHIICTEPEHIRSLYWCFDLLRAGYLSVHVPTALGPCKIMLHSQVIANVSDRFGRQRCSSRHPREAGVAACAALNRMARQRPPAYRPEPACILMVAADLGRGGSERQMLAATAGLVARGYDVRTIVLSSVPSGQPSFEDEFVKLGIPPQQASEFVMRTEAGFKPITDAYLAADLSKLVLSFSALVSQLVTAIRHHRPQIVHGWLDRPGLAAALAATNLGTPGVVIQYGSMPFTHQRQYRPLYFREGFRALARNPSVTLINNSAAGAADYERWLGLRPGSVRLLHNAFMKKSVRIPSRQELSAYRARLGLPPDVPVVGTVIRFAEEKDPNLWLAAAAEIAKARPEVWFVLAGYGELLERSIARAEALGLRGRVVFAGPVEDVGLIYAMLNVFLLTSKVEGLPNVLIEAQAAGCPVVTTDVGGTAEALVNGVTGRVVHERSPEYIAQAVLEMLADPTWRDRVHTHAPALIARRFGFERMVDQTLEIYRMPSRRSADRSDQGS